MLNKVFTITFDKPWVNDSLFKESNKIEKFLSTLNKEQIQELDNILRFEIERSIDYFLFKIENFKRNIL